MKKLKQMLGGIFNKSTKPVTKTIGEKFYDMIAKGKTRFKLEELRTHGLTETEMASVHFEYVQPCRNADDIYEFRPAGMTLAYTASMAASAEKQEKSANKQETLALAVFLITFVQTTFAFIQIWTDKTVDTAFKNDAVILFVCIYFLFILVYYELFKKKE